MLKHRVYERAPIDHPNQLNLNNSFVEDIERYLFAASFVSGKRVLDLACGTGYGSWLLSTKGEALWVLGVDSSNEAITTARRFQVLGRVEFCLCNAKYLPVKSDMIDAVVSFETIEHIPDPSPFLGEMARVLRHGGRAIISTPMNNSQTRFHPSNPFHCREYSTEEFVQLCRLVCDDVHLYTQVSTYQDDLWPETLESSKVISYLRRVIGSMTSVHARQVMRAILRSRGRHVVRSRIIEGIHEHGSVQIAVCYK